MSEVPDEPRMVEPKPTVERFCTANKTHAMRRVISSDLTGHVAVAHCPSPTCSWCLACYVAHTGRRPASS